MRLILPHPYLQRRQAMAAEKDDCKLMEMRGITKKYPGVTALDKVDFDLAAGEVHALMGENGAGKSTLIKCLLGIEKMDEGTVLMKDEPVVIGDSLDAAKKGISAVFQDLSLIPYLSIAENVFLNREEKKGLLIDKKSIYKKTKDLIDKYGFNINEKTLVCDLSAAQKQLCEILKAIAISPKILILDEPTASLTENESDILFRIIKEFKKNGTGIIYVSHRMNEIFEIAERVTVLRDGKNIGTKKIQDVDMDDVVKMMVGRDVDFSQRIVSDIDYKAEPLLKVRNLSGGQNIENLSFDLFKGEILGIAGLVGSGRTEMMNLLFGIDKIKSGSIAIDGRDITITDVKSAIDNKIAMLPESRHQEGLVLMHSIKDNIMLPMQNQFKKGFVKDKKKEEEFVKNLSAEFDIKTDSIDKVVSQLSGGNQQKVVIAKWLAVEPKVLIIDEPTAGVDVNAKFEIHKIIKQYVKRGMGVIMISSEMPELLNNSDRILIVNNKRIIGEMRDNFEQEKIMSAIMHDIAM